MDTMDSPVIREEVMKFYEFFQSLRATRSALEDFCSAVNQTPDFSKIDCSIVDLEKHRLAIIHDDFKDEPGKNKSQDLAQEALKLIAEIRASIDDSKLQNGTMPDENHYLASLVVTRESAEALIPFTS